MERTQTDILLDKIKECNNAYRAGIPIVSDRRYDEMVDQLRKLDPDNEWFKTIEPAAVENNRKRQLPVPMKSLNKVKSIDELRAWCESVDAKEVVITPKFDGLSLLYNERTKEAYSRGGSENEGQDCTTHAAAIQFPTGKTQLGFTYGEVVFSKESWGNNFEGQVSKYTGGKYKSPRNTAAGFLNRDAACDELKYLDFFRYGTDPRSLKNFDTYEQLYKYLCQWYFQQTLYHTEHVKNLSDFILATLFKNWSDRYYIDGLVIYVNDLDKWDELGRHENGNPRYAIAYKNPSFTPIFTTTVQEVNWKVSKSGALKPVVKIDTVNTGDCEMENPTGYNAKYIYENKIGKGAEISVTRSGGVIPKILDVISPCPDQEFESMWQELCTCPDCGHPTVWNESKVELVCENPNCRGRQLSSIVFFYITCGAENIGEETLARIYDAGFSTLDDMLDISFEELLSVEGFGDSIANNFLEQNRKIRAGVEVTRLMHASNCFNGIGQTKAKVLLNNLSEEVRICFIEGRMLMAGHYQTEPFYQNANKTWQAFYDGVDAFYDFVARNKLKILPMEQEAAPTSDKYKGFNVCFTGVRDNDLEREIKDGGGKIVSGVSKKTTHLVVSDILLETGKTRKAREYGTKILTLEDFKKL